MGVRSLKKKIVILNYGILCEMYFWLVKEVYIWSEKVMFEIERERGRK